MQAGAGVESLASQNLRIQHANRLRFLCLHKPGYPLVLFQSFAFLRSGCCWSEVLLQNQSDGPSQTGAAGIVGRSQPRWFSNE